MPYLRKLFFAVLATLALGFVFSASQTARAQGSPNMVISQVYGGGGNTGAPFTNDFIELFNRGTTPVDLTGWSVQYNSAAGTGTFQVTVICTTGPCLIQPGQYFLVQEGGGATGAALPRANATGTIAMSATVGRVALLNSTSPISGTATCAQQLAASVDFVGFGTTASCFEGAGPAPAPSNTTADIRNGGGSVDTNNNNLDFTAATPTPRNSLTGTVMLISEFRTFGPTGTCDEFVEIYNASNFPYTVKALDGSAGFAVAQQNNNVLFTIPNNTTIPARGHYLAVNNGGACTGSFSGSAYPAGSPAATATGNNTLNEDIPTNAGIALFNTSTQANFSTANRLDAVGSTTAPALYVEGTGYPLINPNTNNYTIYRDARSGVPSDTGNNETDFRIANTAAASLCTDTVNFNCQRLGAPGPENTSSPVQRNADIKAALVDTSCTSISVNPTLPSACRFERSTGAGSGYGASPTSTGTLSIRRRFTNTLSVPVTRLRFRIVDITTISESVVGNGIADLRAITSSQVTATCQSEGGTPHLCTDNAGATTTIEGTTLETDASGQPNGGAFNSTLSLATPLAAGASVNVQFLLGVERNGSFRFFINVEALPAPTGVAGQVAGSATKAQATGKASRASLKGSN